MFRVSFFAQIFAVFVVLCLFSSTWAGWGEAGNLGPTINGPYFDANPSLSSDGCTLYFNSTRPGGEGDRDIWISKLIGWSATGSVWSPPWNPGPPLNTPYFDGHPCISSNGQQLFFISNRSGGLGDHDIWVSLWTGSEWGQPVNLGYPINSPGWDIGPFISSDGQSLYFSSIRAGGYGHYDIYKSVWFGNEWSQPENLGPIINTDQAEGYSWVDPGNHVLYFHSRGHDGYGMGDLFCSYWAESGWQEPVNLGPIVNTDMGEAAPFLSPDTQTLYFYSNREGGFGDYDIYVSAHRPVVWDQPINAGPVLNGLYFEGQPSISADGKTLYFSSERPGGVGGRDIWISKRIGSSSQGPLWSSPRNLGTALNSIYWDSDPCISQDGQSLYFASMRPPGGESNVDIWVSSWIDGFGWDEPVNLGHPVNSSTWDTNPQISDDGQTLYFDSYRLGGYGGYDIYRSTRAGVGWSEPENLGPEVNTTQHENAPWVNASEMILYFNSNGHGTMGECDIFCSLWTGVEWGQATALSEGVNTIYDEGSAFVTSDMGLLYFHSQRPGGIGNYDLWVSVPLGEMVARLPDAPSRLSDEDAEDKVSYILDLP